MSTAHTATGACLRHLVVTTATAAETAALGAQLASLLLPGDVVPLWGGFGAGKTTFTQGVGRALGVRQPVVSPSYGLVHEYHGDPARPVLNHLDLYRLESAGDAIAIGIEDMLSGDGVTLIEWPGVIESLLPQERLDVYLDLTPVGERRVCFVAAGARYVELLATYARSVGE